MSLASTPLYTKVRSLLPNIPALKGIGMPFGIPWRIIIGVGVVIGVLAIIHFFGEARYAAGVSEEKARWIERTAAAQREVNEASHDEGQRTRQTQADVGANLAAGIEQIQNVPSNAEAVDFLIAWAAADRSLCNAGDCRG